MASDKDLHDSEYAVDPSTGLPYDASTNDAATAREAIADGIETGPEIDCDTGFPVSAIPQRYQLQRGAAGTFSVQRKVNEGVEDWEDHGIPEYWDTICICSSPYAALHIAKALQELHPDGNIT